MNVDTVLEFYKTCNQLLCVFGSRGVPQLTSSEEMLFMANASLSQTLAASVESHMLDALRIQQDMRQAEKQEDKDEREPDSE